MPIKSKSVMVRYHLIEGLFVAAKDYGLFLADEDVKKGVWLEPGRNLDYYILRNGVSTYTMLTYLDQYVADNQ